MYILDMSTCSSALTLYYWPDKKQSFMVLNGMFLRACPFDKAMFIVLALGWGVFIQGPNSAFVNLQVNSTRRMVPEINISRAILRYVNRYILTALSKAFPIYDMIEVETQPKMNCPYTYWNTSAKLQWRDLIETILWQYIWGQH